MVFKNKYLGFKWCDSNPYIASQFQSHTSTDTYGNTQNYYKHISYKVSMIFGFLKRGHWKHIARAKDPSVAW